MIAAGVYEIARFARDIEKKLEELLTHLEEAEHAQPDLVHSPLISS